AADDPAARDAGPDRLRAHDARAYVLRATRLSACGGRRGSAGAPAWVRAAAGSADHNHLHPDRAPIGARSAHGFSRVGIRGADLQGPGAGMGSAPAIVRGAAAAPRAAGRVL